MSLTAICKEIGIHKSKGFSILNALSQYDLITKDSATKTYSLGPALMPLAQKAREKLDINAIAKDHLQKLANETKASVLLGIICNDQFYIAGKYDGNEKLSVTVRQYQSLTWSPGPGCHGGCGILVHVKDEKVIKVEGDPDHPWNQGRLCSRCLSMTQYMYHKDRLKKPLKRVGKRGEGKFEEISWDEAFDLIETKMKKIQDDHGAESVIFHQGTGRDIGGWISMLAYAYGSPNWMFSLSGISCYTPRLMMMSITQGDFAVVDASQWHEKRYEDPEYEIPETVIVWGQNLPATCPDGFFGHWYVDLMKKGTQFLVIDPRCTWIASRAKLWLQLRPGTDAALALGFIHVMIKEDLINYEFIEKWTNSPFLVRINGESPTLLKESDLKKDGSETNFVSYDTVSDSVVIWDTENQTYGKSNIKPSMEGEFDILLANGSKTKANRLHFTGDFPLIPSRQLFQHPRQ